MGSFLLPLSQKAGEGEVEGWLPALNEIGLPVLSGEMLFDGLGLEGSSGPFLFPGVMILLI